MVRDRVEIPAVQYEYFLKHWLTFYEGDLLPFFLWSLKYILGHGLKNCVGVTS